MKNCLPQNHGLSQALLKSSLIHYDTGAISLTDAQYAALEAGVAIGNSILLSAPTSSGKTEVGLIAITTWLLNGEGLSEGAVYLVGHRALARQKHKDFLASDLMGILSLEPVDVVMAIGDVVCDGNGSPVSDPLAATVLIATYEKYLALLAAGGHRRNMDNICIVADEFQLIADSSRGLSVEILFTITKTVSIGQFVGLSAVLSDKDAGVLSSWMGVKNVRVHTREVPLKFMLHAPDQVYTWDSDGSAYPVGTGEEGAADTFQILKELSVNHEAHFPVAVFCMTKKRLKTLYKHWSAEKLGGRVDEKAVLFDDDTEMAALLSKSLPQGFCTHTADLIDAEREIIEQKLENDELSVIFATTTLAQGLNFSFKSVILDSWMRWDFDKNAHLPIGKGEFHNMAGRAGRLGFHDYGTVYYSCKAGRSQRVALGYLSNNLDDLVSGEIEESLLDKFILQIIAAGIARDYDEIVEFSKQTLSGFIQRNQTLNYDEYLVYLVESTLERLRYMGLVQ